MSIRGLVFRCGGFEEIGLPHQTFKPQHGTRRGVERRLKSFPLFGIKHKGFRIDPEINPVVAFVRFHIGYLSPNVHTPAHNQYLKNPLFFKRFADRKRGKEGAYAPSPSWV
jgi:hypothetical protein